MSYKYVCFRITGDQGVKNMEVARFMFTVLSTGTSSFISGKSVHNQWFDLKN